MPEVLNVHVDETNKKIYFFRRIFFSSSEKLSFEKENVIFFKYILKFQFVLFNCSSELQEYLKENQQVTKSNVHIISKLNAFNLCHKNF